MNPDIVGHALDLEPVSVRAVSFLGTAHAMFQEPRQDSFAVASNDSWVIVVVADGIGSCVNSQHGSVTAAEAVADALRSRAVDPHDPDAVFSVASAACREVADRLDVPARTVSSTLTVAVVGRAVHPDGSRYVLVHAVGDSPALLLEPAAARWTYLTPVQEEQANVVHGWVPDRHDEYFSAGLRLPAGSVLVLCSDGFSTPLGDGSGPLGRDLALRWGHGRRELFPFMVDLSFDGYHDDKTVVALWNCPAGSPSVDGPSVPEQGGE